MPNTLAHLGVQGLVTRAIVPRADPKWIYLGAVIPDVPWIIRRVVRGALPVVDAYNLQLYAVVQASLVVSLLLCAACAAVSSAPRKVFGILTLNAVVHLLLDGIQTKWANGVHFFAPFSWELWNAGWFWPDSLVTYVLTAFGAVFVASIWWRGLDRTVDLSLGSRRRLLGAAILFTAYMVGPLALRGGPESADNNFVRTLRTRDDRATRYVEFDRARHVHGEEYDTIRTFAGEELRVARRALNGSATVSVRATFQDDNTILIHHLHDHSNWPRNLASVIGLALVVVAWVLPPHRPRNGSER